MTARDAILGRIRNALTGEPDSPPPNNPDVWPPGTWHAPADLADSFFDELRKVQGEGGVCASPAAARDRLAALAAELGDVPVASVAHPLCQAVLEGMAAGRVTWVDDTWDRARIAALPFGVVPAEYLFADTGTSVLMPRTHAERLLAYLPPVLAVVAPRGALVSHMTDMWEAIQKRGGDPARRGEILFATGPSRTADIEKKLVLGAHGPKRLAVFVVEGG